jgi:hypothetical protein
MNLTVTEANGYRIPYLDTCLFFYWHVLLTMWIISSSSDIQLPRSVYCKLQRGLQHLDMYLIILADSEFWSQLHNAITSCCCLVTHDEYTFNE